MRTVEVRIEKLKELGQGDVNIASYLPRGEPRLMGDIMIMALQNNMTNVSTFMVGPERWSSPMLFAPGLPPSKAVMKMACFIWLTS